MIETITSFDPPQQRMAGQLHLSSNYSSQPILKSAHFTQSFRQCYPGHYQQGLPCWTNIMAFIFRRVPSVDLFLLHKSIRLPIHFIKSSILLYFWPAESLFVIAADRDRASIHLFNRKSIHVSMFVITAHPLVSLTDVRYSPKGSFVHPAGYQCSPSSAIQRRW